MIDLPFAFENADNRFFSSMLLWTDCHNVDSSSFEPYVESVTIIHSAQEFATVDTSLVRDLIIPNNTCNEQSFVELDVSMMSVLERISIGENSLQSIQVGNSSMYSANKVTIQGMNDSCWLLNRSSSIREYFIRREWFVL